jgi:hypothetical protein
MYSLNDRGQFTQASHLATYNPHTPDAKSIDVSQVVARCTSCKKTFPVEKTPKTGTIRLKQPKIFVACVTWHGMSPDTEAEVLELFYHHGRRECTCCAEESGFLIGRGKAQASLLPIARTNAIKTALRTDCTHVLLIDQDTVGFNGDAILRMASHDLPIVSAYICRRSPPFDPVHRYATADPKVFQEPCATPHEAWKLEAGLVQQCWGVGMAFTLIKREVLEAVGDPYFRFIPADYAESNPHSGWFHGEDHSFCVLAKEKGFNSYVDCGVHLGHVRSEPTSVDDWWSNIGVPPLSAEAVVSLISTHGKYPPIQHVETTL